MKKPLVLSILMTFSLPAFAQFQEANEPDPFTACAAVARRNNKTLSVPFKVLSSTPTLKVYEARIDDLAFRIWHNMGRPYVEGDFSFAHLREETQRPFDIARQRAEWEDSVKRRAAQLEHEIQSARESLDQVGPNTPLTEHFRREIARLNKLAAAPVPPFVPSQPSPQLGTEPLLYGAGVTNLNPQVGVFGGLSTAIPLKDRFPGDVKPDLEMALRRGTIRSESQLFELAVRSNQGLLVLVNSQNYSAWASEDSSRMYAISCSTGI